MSAFRFFSKRRSADSVEPATARSDRRTQDNTVLTRSFEAVGIRGRGAVCKAARSVAGKRFLVEDAPALPLAGCNVHCRCTYRAYEDRRQEPRRSADVGVSSRFYVGPERRAGLERRLTLRRTEDDYYGFMRRK